MKTLFSILLLIGLHWGMAYKPSNTIRIKNMKFHPSVLEVESGARVTFVNLDNMTHNVVSTDGKVRSTFLKKNQEFEVEVQEGFKYFCEPHKAMGMTGEIKIKEAK